MLVNINPLIIIKFRKNYHHGTSITKNSLTMRRLHDTGYVGNGSARHVKLVVLQRKQCCENFA